MDKLPETSSNLLQLDSQNSRPCQLLKDGCKLHSNEAFNFISVDGKEVFVFKCIKCVTNEDILPSSLISIDEILKSNESTVFMNFPLSNRKLTREILKSLQANPYTEIVHDIEAFFKSIRVEINTRLDSLQDSMKAKAEAILDFDKDILKMYNEMTDKNGLVQILLDSSTIDYKSNAIKQIFQAALDKNKENCFKIKSAIDKLEELKIHTSLDIPKQIRNEVINALDKLNRHSPININHEIYPFKFTNPPFYQSTEFKIKNFDKEVHLSLIAKNGYLVSQILNNYKGYKLKIKSSIPFGNRSQFRIGLILNENLNKSELSSMNILRCGFSAGIFGNLSFFASKGELLCKNNGLQNLQKTLELRFCIFQKQFYIADSNFQNINQVNESQFKEDQIYNFFIKIDQNEGSEIEMVLSDFYQIDPKLVSKFE